MHNADCLFYYILWGTSKQVLNADLLGTYIHVLLFCIAFIFGVGVQEKVVSRHTR